VFHQYGAAVIEIGARGLSEELAASEEVVWPSRLRLIRRLLGEREPRDLQPGDLMPFHFCPTFGTDAPRGSIEYPLQLDISVTSLFRVGEPIVTETVNRDGNLMSMIYGGLRGARLKITRTSPTVAENDPPWREVSRIELASANITALNVHFGYLAEPYLPRSPSMREMIVGEFVLLALLGQQAPSGIGSYSLHVKTPLSASNIAMRVLRNASGAVRLVGDASGDICLRPVKVSSRE
jgi:hypothetical protein